MVDFINWKSGEKIWKRDRKKFSVQETYPCQGSILLLLPPHERGENQHIAHGEEKSIKERKKPKEIKAKIGKTNQETFLPCQKLIFLHYYERNNIFVLVSNFRGNRNKFFLS